MTSPSRIAPRRPRGQSGFALATVLVLFLLIAVLLPALLLMTNTALNWSQDVRDEQAEISAVDSAMEVAVNQIRRLNNGSDCAGSLSPSGGPDVSSQQIGALVLNLTCEIELRCYSSSGESVDPVAGSCAGSGDRSIRYAMLGVAFDPDQPNLEDLTTLSGRADFVIYDQVTAEDESRVVVREWQFGAVEQSGAFTEGPPALEVEFLIVGGGGAGGPFTGGGGGGGGVVANYAGLPLSVPIGEFDVVVGAGAPGGQPAGPNSDFPTVPVGASGQDSSFNGIVAKGGGGGGSNKFDGKPGGSGGGAGHDDQTGGAGTPQQGNKGGDSNVGNGAYGGGGGGGASSAGGAGSDTRGGSGGAGRASAISGASVVYGGGGGGGVYVGSTVAPGGAGGGGAGGFGTTAPGNGLPNTGGGGGGQRFNVNTTGGAGGSGVVILRYKGTPKATGGTITQSGGYTIHTFTQPGEYTLYVPPLVEYLVVAGGGAGGAYTGGGGGGGGVLTNEGAPFGIEEGTYTVVVGAGAPGFVADAPGRNNDNPGIPVSPSGGDSQFGTYIAKGGGGGGSNNYNGASGGSGGGGGHNNTPGGAGTAGQGFKGGAASVTAGVYGAAGGGGAAAPGGAGSSIKGGDGGAGRVSSMTGVAVTYGSGGGGGAYGGLIPGLGGVNAGIGGVGSPGSAPGSGVPNTGGGGGGQRYNVNTTGGAGGSGIVVIRYPGPPRATATGDAVTRSDGYTYHTFTDPGTYSITFS